MKKFTPIQIIVSAIILVLAGTIVALLLFLYNQPPQVRGIPPLIQIDPMEPDSSLWGENFPNQYSSFLKTLTNNTRTEYGGSEPYEKLDVDPMLRTLFAGYSFSKGYNEDRGHLNSLTDVRNTPRLSETTPGTCYSCKSSNNPELWAEMGMAQYDSLLFSQMTEKISQPIGCANCHEANTMRLIVTNPALEEALAAQGKNWKTFTRQEMRSVVCANCHVEYSFAGEGKYLTLPWKGGTSIEAIDAYYDEIGFTDWTHPDSGAALIKMQHPDFEFFSNGSTHYSAGVSCADCHMPYVRDGAVKYSSHDVHSPLLDSSLACGQCHTDVPYVVDRVNTIQNQVHDRLLATEEALVDAIAAIRAAAEVKDADAALLEEARVLHRRAQLRWDFIAAENSMGFHNPEEALRILAEATDMARQAQLKAFQAAPSLRLTTQK